MGFNSAFKGLNKFSEEVAEVGGKSRHRERLIRSLNDEQMSMAQRIPSLLALTRSASYLKC